MTEGDYKSNLMNQREAARYIGWHQATLHKWRLDGRGPAYYQIGPRGVRYDRADLDSFIKSQRIDPAAAKEAAR
jgi:predicted DNA-binding transcriptional regulator AlpA